MTSLDFFDLNEPKDLYKIIHEVYIEYISHPTERNFLLLTLGFSHLREWIAQCGYAAIDKKLKTGQELSDAEKFFCQMHDIPEFRTVLELCNRSKHHIVTNASPQTSKAAGLCVELGKAGDRLDQTYFLINGRDSREYFIPLIQKYNEWFSQHDA